MYIYLSNNSFNTNNLISNIKERNNPFIPKNFKEDELSKNYKVHDNRDLNKNNYNYFKENKFSYNPFIRDKLYLGDNNDLNVSGSESDKKEKKNISDIESNISNKKNKEFNKNLEKELKYYYYKDDNDYIYINIQLIELMIIKLYITNVQILNIMVPVY